MLLSAECIAVEVDSKIGINSVLPKLALFSVDNLHTNETNKDQPAHVAVDGNSGRLINFLFVIATFFKFGQYNHLKLLRNMPATQSLSFYLQNALESCQQGQFHLPELKTKPSKIPILAFTLRLCQNLELEEELIILSLFLTKKLLQKQIHIPRKCLYKLITISFLIADKLCSDEHHSLETYSLLSCIPIKELVMLQAIIIETLEFQLIYEEREIENFKHHGLAQEFSLPQRDP